MSIESRKPILVGGIAISLGLWLVNSFGESVIHFGEASTLGAIAIGMGFWWWQKQKQVKVSSALNPISINRDTVAEAIASATKTIALVEQEAPEKDISTLKQKLTSLPESLNRQELNLAVTGGKKTGKTSLKQVLEARNIDRNLRFQETEALDTEVEERAKAAKKVNLASDLILFLSASDLTDAEWQSLQELRASHSRSILIFNQQDRYLPEERNLVFHQLQKRVEKIISPEDVIAISASPARIKVRQHLADGTLQERIEQPQPDIDSLCDRLEQIFTREREQLIWNTTWRDAICLKTEGKELLNQARRDRSLPVIEQAQWIAAAAAFANPVAALDLLATVAINAQMLVDLSEIYQQKLSLSQAQIASGTIGKLMVKLGLIELSTQTIASILKTNTFTYVAGGALQGVSAAYLTRLSGLSLIEYFQEQEINADSGASLNFEVLKQKLQKVFEQNQLAALQNFVRQAVEHLPVKLSQSEISAVGG